MMLQAMVDFTIPKSYCNLYYQKLNGKVLWKSYYKNAKTKFYVNGYMLGEFNTLFKKLIKSKFLTRLD